ncbi:M16 family metallopeptidase [Elusimicrobiota bacterium]
MKYFVLLLNILVILSSTGKILYAKTDLEYLKFKKGVKELQFDNGLKLLLKKDNSHPTVSVQVWVKVGSVNEKPDQRGISHFLEHLIFKGTDKYPGDQISRCVETQGGVINAGTSKEFTQYYIDIQKSAYKDAIEILGDVMFNATFPENDINKERPVVLEEITRHTDNPMAVLQDNFSKTMFLKTPYKDNIIGSADVIRKVSRDEIMDYYKTWYTPDNMIVSIVGDIDTDAALRLVKQTFGKQKKTGVLKLPDLKEPFHKERTSKLKKDVEHSYLLAGFIGPDIKSNDQFIADITSTILGGGRSSRLYQSLREEKKLVYNIVSSFWTQRGNGTFIVQSIFDPKNEKEVIAEIKYAINNLKNEGPSDAELSRAKEIIKTQWFFGLETFYDQASVLGYWNMQDYPEILDIYIESIDNIKKGQVQDFLKKYFDTQGLTYSLISPKK